MPIIKKELGDAESTASEYWAAGQDLYDAAEQISEILPELRDRLLGGLVAEGIDAERARQSADQIVGKLAPAPEALKAAGVALTGFSTQLRKLYIDPIFDARALRRDANFRGLRVD